MEAILYFFAVLLSYSCYNKLPQTSLTYNNAGLLRYSSRNQTSNKALPGLRSR